MPLPPLDTEDVEGDEFSSAEYNDESELLETRFFLVALCGREKQREGQQGIL
jgi:hypothetical protein